VWKEEAISNCEGTTFEKRVTRLRAKSRVIEPTIWIGKEGISTRLIQHVENQLKSRELVKVKLQKSALVTTETSSIAERIAAATGSALVDVIGHTFTLYKKKRESAKTMREVSPRKSDLLR
jgi:RNA-binding protein